MMDAFRHIQSTCGVGARSKEDLGGEYPVLKEKYPFLFHKVCTDPNMDLSKLEYLLGVRDSMQGDSTADNEEASRKVGQAMFDAYVKPMLDAKDNKKLIE
jgi:hypothetical protein